MTTYLDYCLEHPDENPNIDDWVDRWHADKAPEGMKLHEYLGFTWEEYGEWMRDPEYASKIVAAQRYMRSLRSSH